MKLYLQEINSNAKFHVTIGHETVMGKATFFCGTKLIYDKESEELKVTVPENRFHFAKEYKYCETLQKDGERIEDDDIAPEGEKEILNYLVCLVIAFPCFSDNYLKVLYKEIWSYVSYFTYK